ncbi:MAG TPA: tRNA lysidine(34) synthetase TilS [Acidobacteriota bacterium]|nr:tRNA lysidine(34) synthetase TilS [Acidobacteriota bacterium]
MKSVFRIKPFIEKHQMLARGDRILVAVSGGPDSVALLYLLFELREELGLHLEVAHLQHGIRGAEAEADARFVAALTERLGLPFHLKRLSLPSIKSAAGKGNLEALAREERYRFFTEIVHAHGLGKVATAHTQDDQAETVLMWFLRGSGMKGLGGMTALHQISSPTALIVVRPLLNLSKAEIVEFLRKRGLAYCIDRTNQDPALLRNWLRLELLPKLQQQVGENLSERLSRQAELMRDEEELLAGLARNKLEEIACADGLRRDGLLAAPMAMQRRLLRLWIEQKRGSLRGLDFVHVDELLRLIKYGAPQGRLALPGGWELVREYDWLKLVRRSARLNPVCYSYPFTAGSTLAIPQADCEIRSEVLKPPLTRLPVDLSEAVFDAACLTGSLCVRNFRRGDYFQPLGMTGHKKIKDLLIDHKVALSLRAKLPFLVQDEEVLWVPGFGRSEIAKVTPGTSAILRLKLVSSAT